MFILLMICTNRCYISQNENTHIKIFVSVEDYYAVNAYEAVNAYDDVLKTHTKKILIHIFLHTLNWQWHIESYDTVQNPEMTRVHVHVINMDK